MKSAHLVLREEGKRLSGLWRPVGTQCVSMCACGQGVARGKR